MPLIEIAVPLKLLPPLITSLAVLLVPVSILSVCELPDATQTAVLGLVPEVTQPVAVTDKVEFASTHCAVTTAELLLFELLPVLEPVVVPELLPLLLL